MRVQGVLLADTHCSPFFTIFVGTNTPTTMEKALGKIKKITDLRSVWSNEALDFTKWLGKEENLSQLGEAIGIELTMEEEEAAVGDFKVDIYASETGTDRKVIIENQLEDTNHDHLGKIITYAAGKDAQVVVWIVKRARDEHRQAVEWLNQHTDSNVGFFLVCIELWQIDNSSPAPVFNVVEKPNDWAKAIKNVEGLNETQKFKVNYWQSFIERMQGNEGYTKNFSFRKARPQHWYNLSLHAPNYHIGLTLNTQKNTIGCEIYVDDDKDLFFKFKEKKEIFEEALKEKIEWVEATKDCRVLVRKNINIKKQENWATCFDWYLEKALAFKKVVKELDK